MHVSYNYILHFHNSWNQGSNLGYDSLKEQLKIVIYLTKLFIMLIAISILKHLHVV